jgi:polyisoprenoid-binding protein YceI
MRTTRRFTVSLLAGVLLASASCKSPTQDKPKAEVGAASTAAPATAGAEKLALSPENSKIDFVAAKVTRSHDGKFKRFTGTAELVAGKAEGGKVTLDIELDSVETDTEKLTGHLRSPDFFDVAKYPKARFESTKIEKGGQGGATHTVTGNLDLHGVKKAITFPATMVVRDDAVTVKSEFSINRKDWGIVYPGMPDDLIRDEVLMKLDINVPRRRI